MTADGSMRKYFMAITEVMHGKYNASKLIGHRGLLGTTRENILAEQLQSLLPDRFGFGRGEIRSSNGNVSKQLDIVVYDKPNCPILYSDNDVQVFPRESVYAVIEVRTHADATGLREFCKSISQLRDDRLFNFVSQTNTVRELQTKAGTPAIITEPGPAGFFFAFEGPDINSLRDSLNNSYDELSQDRKLAHYPTDVCLNSVCILDKGVITNSYLENQKDRLYPYTALKPPGSLSVAAVDSPTDAFMIFFAGLYEVLAYPGLIVMPPGLLSYLPAKEVEAVTDTMPLRVELRQ